MSVSAPRRAAAVAFAMTMAASGSLAVRGHSAPAKAQVFDVTGYGALGDGLADNTNAFAQALAAAQAAGGGTVYVPRGRYLFTQVRSQSVSVNGSYPITFAGAGRQSTVLIEGVAKQDLFGVKIDQSTVQDLTFDTQSHNGGHALADGGSYTTIQRVQVMGGTNTFALRVNGGSGIGTPTNPVYSTGNVVNDVILTDHTPGKDAGFDFSFQQRGTISNVQHTGNRLGLYIDSDVTVSNYTYHPDAQGAGLDGFYITPPASGITINDFVTYGAGGVIGHQNAHTASRIAISRERFMATGGYTLEVGNVDGLTIDGGSFNQSNGLRFDPPSQAGNVLVENTTVPDVRFGQPSTGSVTATFTNDIFPALVLSGSAAPTFYSYRTCGPTSVTISGGTWSNQRGGLYSGYNSSYSVSGLVGYPS